MKYKDLPKDFNLIMDWTCNFCGCVDYLSCFEYRNCPVCGKKSLGNPYGVISKFEPNTKEGELLSVSMKQIKEDDT